MYAFARSAPLADFFGYFLVRPQESNITAVTDYKKVYLLVKRYTLGSPLGRAVSFADREGIPLPSPPLRGTSPKVRGKEAAHI